MEKHIARWTYWLGTACLVIAVIWRVSGIFVAPTPAFGVWPLSFYKGALVFFLAAIASASYAGMYGPKT